MPRPLKPRAPSSSSSRLKPQKSSHGHAYSEEPESSPICRCRVLYLGSAVPHITKDGLQGIQEPLKELYPDSGLSSLKGIDSWLSVWSNGLLLENVDEKNTKITRFFPIESLHYCAAVRNVLVPSEGSSSSSGKGDKIQKFLPLDSPFARLPNLNHPPLFACILRRTTGIKVLECHAFICKREMAANALVRCCFHAYADSTYAKQLETSGAPLGGAPGTHTMGGSSMSLTNGNGANGSLFKDPDRQLQRSVTPLNSIEKVNGWQTLSQSQSQSNGGDTDEDFIDGPISSSTPRTRLTTNGASNGGGKYEFVAESEDEIYEGDENHKIWGGSSSNLYSNGGGGYGGGGHPHSTSTELVYLEPDGTLKSVKSSNTRSKPRQFISPPPPPPPPPQAFSSLLAAKPMNGDDDASGINGSTSKKKMKKKLKNFNKELKGGPQPQQQGYLMRPASMLNLSSPSPHHLLGSGGVGPPHRAGGSVMNGPVSGRPGSAMSTLTRGGRPHPQFMSMSMNPYGPGPHPHPQMFPVPNGYPHPHPHHHMPGMMQLQPIYGHLPQPLLTKDGKKAAKKNKKMQLTPVPLLAPTPHPHLVPHPHMVQHPHQMHSPAILNGHMGGPTPPPLYHHNASKHDDHQGQGQSSSKGKDHNLPSNYATIERGYHYHHNGRPMNLMNMPIIPMNGHGHGPMLLRNGDSATLQSTKSRGHHNRGGGGENSGGGENGGSPFNTGIYRKKGHLNERAFSYSIRQEHRSRSYGSLANLQFASGNGNEAAQGADELPSSEGMKKEREIIQMVRDLELDGDEIERSHVPQEMYPSSNNHHHPMQNKKNPKGSSSMINGYGNGGGYHGHANGGSHGPRITHR